MRRIELRSVVTTVAALLTLAAAAWAPAADPPGAETPTAATSEAATSEARDFHPIDPALRVARDGLENLQSNIQDYTATIVKRELVAGKLGEHQFMFAKIRNRKVENGELKTPFSVYLRFLKPDSVKGREVIWVEGQNDGKLIAHEGGLLGIKTLYLPPEGFLAMMGQRYPITKIGMENLVSELITKGEAQRKYGECEVNFYKRARIDDRTCTMIEVVHPQQRSHFDFYKAQIFIDDERQIPIRYVAWHWPETPGGEPLVLEEYTYRNVRLNVGLTDADFDPENPAYNFP